MEIYINKETTFDASNKMESLLEVERFIQNEFAMLSFGSGFEIVWVILNCKNPEIGIPKTFETGQVVHTKHIKSKKSIELSIKLNFKELMACNSDGEFRKLVQKALTVARPQIAFKSVTKENFDLFWNRLIELFGSYAPAPVNPFTSASFVQPTETPEEGEMDEALFWELINRSQTGNLNEVETQVNNLIALLADLEADDIYGFEKCLKRLIQNAATHKLVIATKIILGYGSDDGLLSIICQIILCGEDFYPLGFNEPDNLAAIPIHREAELLLSVANQALDKKFGADNELELPSDRHSSYHDYNNLEIRGDINEIPPEKYFIEFPRIWNMYGRR